MSQTMQTEKKLDLLQLITDKIIASLEAGVVPWRKTWTLSGLPQNLISRKKYRGVNILLLSLLEYPLSYFLTYRQAIQLGGSVKKGEHGHFVVFVKRIEIEDKVTKEKVLKPFLRYYKVFNVAQCEGIPEDKIPQVKRPNNPIQECELIIENMPLRPSVLTGNYIPHYDPVSDSIGLPTLTDFNRSEDYYSTLFHELIHSTGHQSRLNREDITDGSSFGSETYSKEELTAEFGTCLLKAHAGFEEPVGDNNVSYLKSWLKQLRNDNRFIVHASSQAQRAVDFILNVAPAEKTDPVEEEVA